MLYKYFSHNGSLLPNEQAVVSLSNIEYSYGFGVYETIRVNRSIPFFVDQHIERLFSSASAIDLEHRFEATSIKKQILELINKNEVISANLKILLIGGNNIDNSNLFMLCLSPQYIERQLYRNGVSCITVQYEREYPHAKTLNMLPSYLAYRKAKSAGAYDALLVDNQGNIREGTRTNLLAISGQKLVSPPSEVILPGVMRTKVIEIAKMNGFPYVEQTINLNELEQFDGCFLTSVSSKILPIKQIDQTALKVDSANLRLLMKFLDQFLASYS